ncbi:uncharacterized protein LOC134257373 [Saccostrea cucullata]|uniref:uncharacterized protein LOC134257373 n=1 Tax=Saccostrea cuccullata TaxID=36930 RepID=UPI002ED356E5
MTQSGQVPYTKSLKIQVVAITDVVNYRNDKNESKSLMNAAVVDHSKAVKCTIYDSTKFPRFKEGQYLILRNVIKKTDGVVVTSNTKVFTCAPFAFEIPAAIQQRGREILNPPPAPVVNVKEALDSPPKARVTVRGKVVQEEATREVLFKEEKTKVKNIYIEDTSSRCKVALWRENTEENVRPGDYVQITDVVTNSYRNEVSLSTTFRTKISKIECPAETTTHECMSACIEDNTATFLLCDDTIITLPKQLVQVALPDVKVNDLESHLMAMFTPTLKIKCTSRGDRVSSLEIMPTKAE